MRLFMVGALVLAGPAMAQELPYSDALTQNCLAGAGDATSARACIGRSADACIATPDGGTTVGMGGCLKFELTFWDNLLNANYKQRMSVAKEIDAEMQDLGATVPLQAPALRDMQRAWITYRDATCDYARSQWGGGTGGGPATVSCLLDLTGQQALYLTPEPR